jgi:multidrug resistance efflux pump
VAELSAIELTASVGQARAALAAATADRNNVYAGVRAEQVASLAAEIAKAKSRLEYQLSRTTYLARSEAASQQALDQAQNDVASARADVAETTTPRSPGRPKRSVPSRTRRSRRRRPRSRCLNGGSTRPSCGLRLTALSV